MNKTFFRLVVVALVLLFASNTYAQQGKKLYEDNCQSCHTIGKGNTVGPDLKGVGAKYPEAWIIKWIKNSQAMVKAKDPKAVAIFNQFNQIPMPPFESMSDADIKAVMAYVKSQSGAKK